MCVWMRLQAGDAVLSTCASAECVFSLLHKCSVYLWSHSFIQNLPLTCSEIISTCLLIPFTYCIRTTDVSIFNFLKCKWSVNKVFYPPAAQEQALYSWIMKQRVVFIREARVYWTRQTEKFGDAALVVFVVRFYCSWGFLSVYKTRADCKHPRGVKGGGSFTWASSRCVS